MRATDLFKMMEYFANYKISRIYRSRKNSIKHTHIMNDNLFINFGLRVNWIRSTVDRSRLSPKKSSMSFSKMNNR